MCARKTYTVILFICYVLICTVVGFDTNRPHRQQFFVEHADDDINSENLQVTIDQHPWERRSFPLVHGAPFLGGHTSIVLRKDSNFEDSELSSEESTAAVIHRALRMRPPPLNGNVLDTEVNVPDPQHPWRLGSPYRRRGFHNSRWRGASYNPDSDESSEETEHMGNRRRFNNEFEQDSKGPTGTATVSFHRSIKVVPSPRLVGNVLDEEVRPTDPHHPWRVQWPHSRRRFHHFQFHDGHFEQGTDELSEEDEHPDKKTGNGVLRPRDRNQNNQVRENKKDSEVNNVNTSTIVAETAISSQKDKTTATRATEESNVLEETTTAVPKVYEATTTDDTSDFNTTADTIGIDVRGGFV